jgi:hypothetical protein
MIDRELYLPERWTDDPARCRAARVPEQVAFRTKPQLAQLMLERALDSGVPASWVTADEVYGGSPALPEWLQERHLPYVLAVKCTELLQAPGPDSPGAARTSAEQLAAGVPAEQWIACSAGHGAKGPLLALLVPSAIISCTGSAGRRPGAGPVRRAGAGGGALRHPTHQPPWSCRAARLGRAWRASVDRGGLPSWWWRSRRPTRPTDSTTGSGSRSADLSRRRRSKDPCALLPLRRAGSATQASHPADSRDAARCQAAGRVVDGRRSSPSAPASGGERGGQLLGGAAGAKHRACPDVPRAQIPPTLAAAASQLTPGDGEWHHGLLAYCAVSERIPRALRHGRIGRAGVMPSPAHGSCGWGRRRPGVGGRGVIVSPTGEQVEERRIGVAVTTPS